MLTHISSPEVFQQILWYLPAHVTVGSGTFSLFCKFSAKRRPAGGGSYYNCRRDVHSFPAVVFDTFFRPSLPKVDNFFRSGCCCSIDLFFSSSHAVITFWSKFSSIFSKAGCRLKGRFLKLGEKLFLGAQTP